MFKKVCYSFIFLILWISPIMAQGLEEADQLNHQGQYEAELKLLNQEFDPSTPRAALIWRIGRAIYEIADRMPGDKKEEKINKFSQGIDFLAPYLEIKAGSNRDRANIVHWYAAHIGSKADTIGALKALNVVPQIRSLTDKALAIDPTFSDPYFVKSQIDDRLPTFVGGDKHRMAVNLSKALQYNDKELTVLVDGAKSLHKRNWSSDKKKEINTKKNLPDGTPPDLSDRAYALQLLKKTIQIYQQLANPSSRDQTKYNEAKKLLKQWQ